jgi:hypothetical protein
MLRRIRDNANEPWLMLGDFNETMHQHEHFSKMKRSKHRMLDFRRMLAHCNLHDLGYVGPAWTFDNRQKEGRNIKARLDRAVASHIWSELFPDVKFLHIISTRSDHLLLLVELEKQSWNNKTKENQKPEMLLLPVGGLPDKAGASVAAPETLPVAVADGDKEEAHLGDVSREDRMGQGA